MHKPTDWQVTCPRCARIIDCHGMKFPDKYGDPVPCIFPDCRHIVWITREMWDRWSRSKP